MIRVALVLALVLPLQGAWLNDLAAGKKQAAEEKKDLYLIFTSLKASGACMQLDKRVLSQEAFQEVAGQRFVLVSLDLPLDETPEADGAELSNRAIAQMYDIATYPTALYLDQLGRIYLREEGALTLGPAEYADHLLERSGEQLERERALQAAGGKEGMERAQAIVDFIKSLPSTASPELSDGPMKELAKLDPDDSLGFQKERQSEVAFRELELAIREVFHKDSYEEVVKLVDQYVETFEPRGERLQRALFPKLAALRHGKQTAEAIETAGVIIEAGPDSSHGRLARQIVEALK